ncbi:hypothetical protein D3C84_1076560 [compost metagenome]
MNGDGFPFGQQLLESRMVLRPCGFKCFTWSLIVFYWQVKPLDAEHLTFFWQKVDLVLKQLLGWHQRQ